MKKLIKLKINKILKYWNYLNILRKNGILVFCQNLSLSAIKDFQIARYLNDLNYKWKKLNKKIIKKKLDKFFYLKTKNYKNILIIDNMNELKNIVLYLEKNDILILGYYIQNVFFFKKDFEIKKIEKKNIIDHLKKWINIFWKQKINILFNLKYLLKKIILLLNKKYGNN